MQHLALIMDGNRRWAKNQGFSFDAVGYDSGVKALERAITCCLERQIKHLSVYTFSIENFKRPDAEKNYLFGMLKKQSPELIEQFKQHGVRIQFVGDRSLFPESVQESVAFLEAETKDQTNLNLYSLFCYGGQQEIVHAARIIAEKVAAGILTPHQVTREVFEQHLWAPEAPAPELIIRTGGCDRLSNFLTYQSAYSELMFLDVLWPDLNAQILGEAIDSFNGVKRNFGC